ncbi:MAG: ABC transporter ATP-binding protein [Clostridia bacterium]|nr:ABC transporter ATP-binding protein [Clostridia bacterium]
MSEYIMKTENVVRRFQSGQNTVTALGGVSVEIPRGALTVLRGRSGSGKTTLLNILSGLDTPTEGEVFFEDKCTSKLSSFARDTLRRKKMGFIFQAVALMPDMSALENVEYGLRICGINGAKARKKAKECLEMVGMEKRMGHYPIQLSGGEAQRVAIARGLAHDPAMLFADEPTAELDTATAIVVVDLFKRLIVENGITVLMTTHDPHMLELADKVYTLSDGVITDGND